MHPLPPLSGAAALPARRLVPAQSVSHARVGRPWRRQGTLSAPRRTYADVGELGVAHPKGSPSPFPVFLLWRPRVLEEPVATVVATVVRLRVP